MSLLREIQNTAIDSNIELASLLRKCKVLAVRLGSTEFKAWVDNELSGYKSQSELPEYRILNVNSKGHFSGAFGSGINYADIPLMCIPEKLRESMSYSYMMEPVASLEALVANSDGIAAQEPWNPDIVVLVGQGIYQGMNCMQAWKVIPITAVIATLDEIRNRILNFVLEIEVEAPDAGEAAANSRPVPTEKINQIFNTYISGTVQNVATGSHSFKQHATTTENNADLFAKILEALSTITDQELNQSVSACINHMDASQNTDAFKSNYQKFMTLLSDHITVLGPIIAPYLPALAALVP
mgnify:CR=1 FL=1